MVAGDRALEEGRISGGCGRTLLDFGPARREALEEFARVDDSVLDTPAQSVEVGRDAHLHTRTAR
eukprot:7389047-Pyramimonas_sp.AAC.1